jgi:hypothetical protein
MNPFSNFLLTYRFRYRNEYIEQLIYDKQHKIEMAQIRE